MTITKMCPAAMAVAFLAASDFERLVVAVHAREAGSRGFVERDAELHLRDGVDQRLVKILHGFDEVGLPEDDVPVLGNLQANGAEFHLNNQDTTQPAIHLSPSASTGCDAATTMIHPGNHAVGLCFRLESTKRHADKITPPRYRARLGLACSLLLPGAAFLGEDNIHCGAVGHRQREGLRLCRLL